MIPIVMAGGFGTRIRPLSAARPKPMVPVVNRPILDHVLSGLKRHGFDEAVLLLYHQPEVITEAFGDGERMGMKLHYYHGDADYGTAGAVKKGVALARADRYFVLSGDVICDFDLASIVQAHTDRGAEVTITLTRVSNPLQFGIVITEPDGRVNRFLEKPTWGEVFSDTINTGIYILERSAIEAIEDDRPVDFSKDLFPKLLAEGRSIHGTIQEGYWRDIGDPESYVAVHADICRGQVRGLEVPGQPMNLLGRDVRAEGEVHLAEDAELRGTVVLGKGSRIGSGARLENCVVGPGAVVDRRAELRGAVVWEGAEIGEDARIESAVVCERAVIGPRAVLDPGSVVGDGSTVGREVRVKGGVKIWPRKVIEDFGVVNTNVVWAERWKTSAFEESAVVGLTNFELTPELAAKLGAAYGTLLPEHAIVLTSRDAHPASRMLRRAFVGGLGSTGVDISDLSMSPIPIVRFRLHQEHPREIGGVFFQQVHLMQGMTAIRFYDADGSEIPTSTAKNIERVFFREDFRRVDHDRVGVIHDRLTLTANYQEAFLERLRTDTVRSRRFRVVVDYSHSSSAVVLPQLLSRLGTDQVTLNAQTEGGFSALQLADVDVAQNQLASIVRTLEADLGVWIEPGSERFILADRKGRLWREMEILLILGELLKQCPRHPDAPTGIILPAHAPSALVQRFRDAGFAVEQVPSDPRRVMRSTATSGVLFGSSGMGDIIFPDFHTSPDAMFAVAKLLEKLAMAETDLVSVGDALPTIPYVSRAISCPVERKGRVMRRLAERAQRQDASFIEGVKIHRDGGWVMVRADRTAPRLHIIVEAATTKRASKWLNEHEALITEWIREPG